MPIMNRISTLILIGMAGLLASCGSSSSSSTQPAPNDTYSIVASPTQLSLGEGDFATIAATEELSVNFGPAKPVSPQPTLRYASSDPRVTVSPHGEVCAGQWDAKFITCSQTAIGFTLTAAADASSGTTVYTGTIPGGDSNAFKGQAFTVSGFQTPANNGTFVCTGSSATTLTLSNVSGVAETHAGTATGGMPGGPAFVFTLTAAADASSGTTVYTGTFPGGDSNAFKGETFTVSGFQTSANDGTFVCTGSSATTLTLANPNAVAETHAGIATEGVQGPVTITASDLSRGVSASVTVTVHARVARVALSSSNWGARTCISQSNPIGIPVTPTNSNVVQYIATAFDASSNQIPSCTASPGAIGCIRDNDYTWTTGDSNVAQVSSFGNVASRNPGVTAVQAAADGVSGTLDFVTCPPASIVLTTSPYNGGAPPSSGVSNDLSLNKGDQEFVIAQLVDTNGNTLVTAPLTFVASNPLNATLTPDIALTDILAANTPGRFSLLAACEPPTCNPAVSSFFTPAGPGSGKDLGFGFPVYSNPLGVTVLGQAGSAVLVTGATFTNGNAANQLLVFDSETLSLTQEPVALPNTPNSLVVSSDGTKAYLGSSTGLMMLDLTTFLASAQNFTVTGQLNTFLVTGTVLGTSAHGRYVVVFDPLTDPADTNLAQFSNNNGPTNSLVFLIDTQSKTATLSRLPVNANIRSVAFAGDADLDTINIGDGNRLWLGGDAGVYALQAGTFVRMTDNDSSHVTSLAWMPDGQSYFASGDQLVNRSTCDNSNPQTPAPNFVSTVPQGLATTAENGVPHVIGLDNTQWFDYKTTTNGAGDACLSGVIPTLATTPVTDNALPCTAQQVTFSPTLEEAFITGVAPHSCAGETAIHGYNMLTQQIITIDTRKDNSGNPIPLVPLSGGVLSDGSKLFFGSVDTVNGQPTGQLHRINLASQSEDIAPTPVAAIPITGAATLTPTFVAVVPK